MGRALGYHAGGIRSLDILIEAHRTAAEFDLIGLGLRLRDLGTDDLTWSDLWAICKHLPPGSALARALNPGDEWQLNELLLADIADSLRWIQWSKTRAAQKPGARPPRRIPRPGIEDDREVYGTTVMSIEDMDKFLGWGDRKEG
ncbi:DUF5361 domain-containing protein [Nocardia thailandica]